MGGNAAFCLSGSGCDIVQGSRYGTLLGVPTALWGALMYAAIGALAALGLTAPRWTLGLLPGRRRAWASRSTSPRSRCSSSTPRAPTAWRSAAIMVAILRGAAAAPRRPAGPPDGSRALVPGALAAAILAPLGAAFVFAMPAGGGAGFEGALARHLRETGAVMYGAYWCPHCTEQKALFGDAAKDVPYVECDRGRGQRPRPTSARRRA